ncbi:hypothetical protein [Gloeothece verrucosa]|uniref:Uncharacterized protein n=1 Tax=Gloeothece verrucosa (strain PCC 7822) TaxID=497965 RepID=E0U8I1_GLOV7|nr:hypothetical protein [Gloeothece verrucosa]ADN13727.1 conserved hypothetical protein [Gloeothece verrucosa PCC 7822]
MQQVTQHPTLYLLSLLLPTECECSLLEKTTYQIRCPDFVTAFYVWNRRMLCIYPLLRPGDMVEVIGDNFYHKSNPLP